MALKQLLNLLHFKSERAIVGCKQDHFNEYFFY